LTKIIGKKIFWVGGVVVVDVSKSDNHVYEDYPDPLVAQTFIHLK
jgi:hypothetical protein